MITQYVELHVHSFYSFGEGSSHVHEYLDRALEFGYSAIGLTDTNLCGALEFARLAKDVGIKPITGSEITLSDFSHLTLIARTREGYANISRLLTYANMSDRNNPRIDVTYLSTNYEGVVLLTGCRKGAIPSLISKGRYNEARRILQRYIEWFGNDAVYVELNQNFVHGDTRRNRELICLAQDVGARVVATNNVHYHHPNRHKLQTSLVAIKNNSTIDCVISSIRPNGQFYLKSPHEMQRIFAHYPEAIKSTIEIAESCSFDLSSDLGYRLPTPSVPQGYTRNSYFQKLCYESAVRRYGSITNTVDRRLREEFNLIEKHELAGFLLMYREIVQIAQGLMVEEGYVRPEVPLDECPPGRGRGSSVALLTGYLIGISHVDPLVYDLSLERFLPDDLGMLPDIDLDFPRSLREKLIVKIHEHFGPDHAVLAGAIATYNVEGAISDIGKVFRLPKGELNRLAKVMHARDPHSMKSEMLKEPGFRNTTDAQGWCNLIELVPQLMGAPKYLGQHPGGVILSSSPISDMVPIRSGAIDGRYIMDWNKDNVSDAGFAKIDVLSLPVLDQIEEALSLVECNTNSRPDLSQISPDDPNVYDLINQGRSIGVFQLQSPAQLKMAQRLKPRNITDLAYQVALIRPGVGMKQSAVSRFIERYRYNIPWQYDHPLEKRALERGCGIIVWQEQIIQLAMDVAGMSGAEADEMRRAFGRSNNDYLMTKFWDIFKSGALKNGVPENGARKIFSKISGHYMFPESHSYAFAITAYQAAWIKFYYPLEFFTSLMNNQPMGFYPLETIKEDAKCHNVFFINPDVNLGDAKCIIKERKIIIGFKFVKYVGEQTGKTIVEERHRGGPYLSVGDFVRRTFLNSKAIESLVKSGAFDHIESNRKVALWTAGLYQRRFGAQMVLPFSFDHNVPEMKDFTNYEKMLFEYSETLGIYPNGHIMEFLRAKLKPHIVFISKVYSMNDGAPAVVAGVTVVRQRPRGKNGVVFITISDESGNLQLIVWPTVYDKFRLALSNSIILVHGVISKRDRSTNLIVSHVEQIRHYNMLNVSHDWY